MELVQQLRATAEDVTRQLPEAHVVTRRYRETRFDQAIEDFLHIVFQVDPMRLTESQLEQAQRWTRVVQKAVELHMLLKFTSRDATECGIYTGLVSRLREALEALDAGVSPDPIKRPSDEQMLSMFSESLRRAKVC